MNIEDYGFVLITSYLKPNCGKDVSAEIQRAIDENPNKTIYFPDGEYILSRPILTPADPKLSVSLKLSNYATLRASEDWNYSEAMVRLGASHPANDIDTPGSNYYFEGGIIDCRNIANGLSIDGGRETAVRNVSIKRAFIGLYIKYGANNCSSDCDIDTVNIVGNGKPGSIGVLIDAADNTLTNMRIASVQIGVKLLHSGNFLRNVHPLFIYEPELEGYFAYSYGFMDLSRGNWYDMCYSDQFATGFYSGPEAFSTYDICRAFWYSAKGNKQVGFEFDGQMLAIMLGCKVTFRFPEVEGKYMTVKESGGSGVVSHPTFNPERNHDNSYLDYADTKVIACK